MQVLSTAKMHDIKVYWIILSEYMTRV